MLSRRYDQFDFLIDIVPRDDIKPSTSGKPREESGTPQGPVGDATVAGATTVTVNAAPGTGLRAYNPDPVNYFVQMNQPQAAQVPAPAPQPQVVPSAVQTPQVSLKLLPLAVPVVPFDPCQFIFLLFSTDHSAAVDADGE